ncbi:hypothetical protein Pan241w_16120 [Gimesia alba]|uniref:Uncharacterized protein n=1 Tax=Gimesia alba TaxID=2527973 RepID=A0A517RCD4_9PLAN|nr:hypothetical protein Pan241w_16120 [Gimesia alba]
MAHPGIIHISSIPPKAPEIDQDHHPAHELWSLLIDRPQCFFSYVALWTQNFYPVFSSQILNFHPHSKIIKKQVTDGEGVHFPHHQ